MRITAKNVADALGLSTATVSLAKNHRPGVKQETRKRVLEFIAEAEKSQATLASDACKTVNYVVFIRDKNTWNADLFSLFAIASTEINRTTSQMGYEMRLISIQNGVDSVDEVCQSLAKNPREGVLVSASYMDPENCEKFMRLSSPFLLYDADFSDGKHDTVLIGNASGTERALKFLYDRGHRNIAYFQNSFDIYNFVERRRAFRHFMFERQLSNSEDAMFATGSTVEEVYNGVMRYLAQREPLPSAIFCENYVVSIGTIKALHDSKLRIPQDVSVVGFDELPDCMLLDFKLTCVKVMHEQKARIAAQRLIQRMEGMTNEVVRVYVETELIEGNSVSTLQDSGQM